MLLLRSQNRLNIDLKKKMFLFQIILYPISIIWLGMDRFMQLFDEDGDDINDPSDPFAPCNLGNVPLFYNDNCDDVPFSVAFQVCNACNS